MQDPVIRSGFGERQRREDMCVVDARHGEPRYPDSPRPSAQGYWPDWKATPRAACKQNSKFGGHLSRIPRWGHSRNALWWRWAGHAARLAERHAERWISHASSLRDAWRRQIVRMLHAGDTDPANRLGRAHRHLGQRRWDDAYFCRIGPSLGRISGPGASCRHPLGNYWTTSELAGFARGSHLSATFG